MGILQNTWQILVKTIKVTKARKIWETHKQEEVKKAGQNNDIREQKTIEKWYWGKQNKPDYIWTSVTNNVQYLIINCDKCAMLM